MYVPNPVNVTIRGFDDLTSRRVSRSGPDRSYVETDGYLPYKVISAKAWFMEDSYVYTEVVYKTMGRRIVYFSQNSFVEDCSYIPKLTPNGKRAELISDFSPYYGPGNVYDNFGDSGVILRKGTQVLGFFQVDDYIFCEFAGYNGQPARGWIRENVLRLL